MLTSRTRMKYEVYVPVGLLESIGIVTDGGNITGMIFIGSECLTQWLIARPNVLLLQYIRF